MIQILLNYFVFDSQEDSLSSNRVKQFCKSFNIATLLNRCRIRKAKGFAAKDIFFSLYSLPFFGNDFFHDLVENKNCLFGKDAVYEFLKSETFNWRKFTLALAIQLVAFFDRLINKHREKVLIVDDSTISRPRSKMVELLSWVRDHKDDKFHKGYRFLSLCWSDGNSFLPLDFSLFASVTQKSRLLGVTKNMDKRSCGYKRRMEAMTKDPDVLHSMIKRVLGMGVRAKYLFMDSWFAMPSTIAALRDHIHIVGMIKKSPNIHSSFRCRSLDIESIYRLLKKRPGSAKILTSTLVGPM